MQAVERDGGRAAGKADALGHLGNGADPGVLPLVARDEQHSLLVADVDGDRDVHVREDDRVVKRDKQQVAQDFTFLS